MILIHLPFLKEKYTCNNASYT